MKRFIILLFLILSLSSFSQNFFWSHTGGEKICFGFLYNWYVTDLTGGDTLTSSDDWSVPITADWSALTTYLGGFEIAGGKVKTEGFIFWNTPNAGATNESGFNAKGSGHRSNTGTFTGKKFSFHCWMSAARNYGSASSSNDNLLILVSSFSEEGKAIRLIKDAAELADGVTTTYTGNDSKTYNAIVINELYWTTENLEETEYRDNSAIANITDNTEWSDLTTGAYCLYDNNVINSCK
jgi:uncharacterized protein (TIGR02145 family)